MSRHTPGPWKVEKHEGAVEVWNQKTFICTTDSKVFRTAHSQFEDEPNARLIAAAPEMLEALKRLADAVDSGNVSEQSIGALQAYRAIAKAEGGEK